MPNLKDKSSKPHDGSKYATCKIFECVCDHEYQDKRYGKNKRVHNPCKSPDKEKTKYRCTVCGRTTTN
ncbi:MAG: hypothetical protein AABY22_02415 [Nanoarchaeota archaeon]